jgi:hypothetical protein
MSPDRKEKCREAAAIERMALFPSRISNVVTACTVRQTTHRIPQIDAYAAQLYCAGTVDCLWGLHRYILTYQVHRVQVYLARSVL